MLLLSLQLIRLGFDDESSISKLKKLHNTLNQLRYPQDISLGIKNQLAFQVVQKQFGGIPDTKTERSPTILSVSKKKSRERVEEHHQTAELSGKGPSHFKLVSDLSRAPYCIDYDRLGLGSVNIPSKNKGNPWRLTTINLPYTMCNRFAINNYCVSIVRLSWLSVKTVCIIYVQYM